MTTKFTVAQLRELLRERNLPMTGNRADLLLRLQQEAPDALYVDASDGDDATAGPYALDDGARGVNINAAESEMLREAERETELTAANSNWFDEKEIYSVANSS